MILFIKTRIFKMTAFSIMNTFLFTMVFLLSFSFQAGAAPLCADLFRAVKGEQVKSADSSPADLLTVQDLFNFPQRPTVEDILRVPRELRYTKFQEQSKMNRTLKGLLFEVSRELFSVAGDRTVYIFARDGELIHDAVQTLLLNHPRGKYLKDKFKLINISTPVSKVSLPEQMRSFLKSHGMNLEALLSGKEKVLWVDTGFRGGIYLRLYKAILELIDFKKPQEEIKKQIVNLLKGAEGVLISSRAEPGTQRALNETVLDSFSKEPQMVWNNHLEVSAYLNIKLYFREFELGNKKELGIPLNGSQRILWTLDNIEKLPHFQTRALKLDAEGKEVVLFEPPAYHENRVTERWKSLQMQMEVVDYFSTQEVNAQFRPLIDRWVEHVGEVLKK